MEYTIDFTPIERMSLTHLTDLQVDVQYDLWCEVALSGFHADFTTERATTRMKTDPQR